MIILTAHARLRGYSAAYVAYRDYVIAQGGSIASASATQAAIDLLDTVPMAQWLDARFGVQAAAGSWYSLSGRSSDVVRTEYGNPMLGTDALLNQATWASGAWKNGVTPRLELGDDYTWGMYCYLEESANGYLWGDRADSSSNQNFSAWNWLSTGNWRSYNNGVDADVPLTLPRRQWQWVWVIKRGATVTGYLNLDSVLFTTTLAAAIPGLSCGIAGGTDSIGVLSRDARYRTFVRAGFALSDEQLRAVMAV